MSIDTALLDLDRLPNLEKLKAFFKKHDWSTAKLSDPKSRSADKTAKMKEIKKIMDTEFEKVARKKGLGASSKYFENKMRVKGECGNVFEHQGNPLLELRDNTEDLVSDAVYEIEENHEDVFEAIFNQFDLNDPYFEQKADAFLHNAIGTMLDVMEYEKLAKLIHEMSSFEDFNPNIRSNFRAEDHERRWYHLDTKHQTLPDPGLDEKFHAQNPRTDEQAIANVLLEEYWQSLDEKDRKILKLLMGGYTQEEVAEVIGMANNSGVSKRLSKMRKEFTNKTGIEIK